MKKYYIIISMIILLICTIVPTSAVFNLSPSEVEFIGASNYSGHIEDYAIDDNYPTYAHQAGNGGTVNQFKMTFGSGGIDGCYVYNSASATAGYYFIPSFDSFYYPNTSWTGTASAHYLNKSFPERIPGNVLYVFTKGQWTWINEIDCWSGTPPADMLPNFTGTPVDGYSPLEVSFTFTNFSVLDIPSGENVLNFGDGQIGNITTSVLNHTYQNPGIYTVSMYWKKIGGETGIVTKLNYVLVSEPSGIAVNLDIKNAITGALVQDSTVGIQNTTTGVWRNTTAPTGLVYFTSTDPGYLYPLSQNQSITLAANKSGYQDASKTFNIPYNNYREILYMVPTSVINSTGNGTVVVNVIRALNGLTVSGMSVAMDTGHVGITNTAGAVTLFNVSAGERTVTVTDPSDTYLPTEKVFNLSAGETKLVTVYVARDDDPPIDPDDPFTSPTPTPTGTYDPDDPNSPVYGNYTTSEINQQGGAGVMGMLAQLIALWPAIVIFAFLKFMRSAMT